MTSQENRKLQRAARRQYVREEKVRQGCKRCGYNSCAEALDYHHRDPDDKEDLISQMVDKCRAWPRLLAEIAKCDVLCANCHREHGILWAVV